MAPKKGPSSTPAATQPVQSEVLSSKPVVPAPPNSTSQNPLTILSALYTRYARDTPQQTKIIDTFMGFLVVTGALQFLYCVVAGNYPFNAFLAGFSATVGQFVLTASLRMQSNSENKGEFSSISPERAFADYVFGSLVLHFFCINFIN